jgi:pyruvate/2-oxoglutarate/acetoin dehydrogenase E1 component
MSEQMNYRQTVARALADEMETDETVLLIGEDIGASGSPFKTTVGLFERFGPNRVRDTPISEQAIIGAAIGAGLTGLRPVADLMFADLAAVCFDQLVNQLAKYRYMTGGQATVPVTVLMTNGGGAGSAAQHSQSVEHWMLNTPGLKIVVPGTVEDLYGLIRSAIQEPNPVLVFLNKSLFGVKGSVDPMNTVPLGKAAKIRDGADLTIVAAQQMRHRALAAAGILDSEGIQATVIDPRSLVPFDDEAVASSLRETARLLVVQEGPAAGSWGASLIARMAESCFELFDARPTLLSSDHIPVPHALSLEGPSLPSPEQIAAAALELVRF